jgi:putative MATE family efflux protein
MRSLWLANGINIVLDPLLIYGVWFFPEMGLAGAAVATTIGRSVGIIYQLNHLFGYSHRIKLTLNEMAFNLELTSKLIKISAGGVIQFLIATASWIALVRIISSYGSAAVAGYTIAIRLVMFSILPAWGLSNAVATLVGQNIGAGQAERAEQSVWKVAKYNVYYLLSVALVFLVFNNELVGIFSQDAKVLKYAGDTLRFFSYSYGFFAIGMIVVQAFNGAGDTMTPTKINFFCYWLVQIPLAYILAQVLTLGPKGVFIAIALSQCLLALVAVMVFRQGKWKLTKI